MCDPPHAESTRRERNTLAGQLVIIIALNWHRGRSATSTNNEVTKTGKNDGVRGRERERESCRGRVLLSVLGGYNEDEVLNAHGSLYTRSDLGPAVNFVLDRMLCDYLTRTGLKTAQ